MSKTEEEYGMPVTINEMVKHYQAQFLKPDQFRDLLVALQESIPHAESTVPYKKKEERIKEFVDYINFRGVCNFEGDIELSTEPNHNDRYQHFKISMTCLYINTRTEAEKAIIIERIKNKLNEIAWRDFQIKIEIRNATAHQVNPDRSSYKADIVIDKMVYWWEKEKQETPII